VLIVGGLTLQILVNTIRNEIAMCSEKAYPSIPVANGINLFFLDSERAVVEFAREVSCGKSSDLHPDVQVY